MTRAVPHAPGPGPGAHDRVLRRGHGHEALLTASGGHPFVRWDVPPQLSTAWWQVGDAVAFRRLRRRGVAIAVLGSDDAVAVLLDRLDLVSADVARAGHRTESWPLALSVPQHLEPLLHDRFVVEAGGSWEFFVTTTPPPPDPVEVLVTELDDTGRREEVAAFLATHSPTADTAPGEGERWWCIEADGRLLATAALGRTPAGAPSLSSVAVASAVRGRGLGRAIVGAVTRRAVAASGVCTLGMYSDNVVGRHLYAALGYTSPVAWASRLVRTAC